jgi:hypothetical protein
MQVGSILGLCASDLEIIHWRNKAFHIKFFLVCIAVSVVFQIAKEHCENDTSNGLHGSGFTLQ